MAGDKYLKVGGATGQTEGQAIQSSAGAGDAGKIIAADSSGKIDTTFMPTGFGSDTVTVTAGEALSAGNLVYINSSGQALKADASSATKAAVGFVLSSYSSSASATVYFGSGLITGLSGLTAGTVYFLHTTAGAVTATAPTGTNKIQQQVGYAITTTELYFEPQQPILLI